MGTFVKMTVTQECGWKPEATLSQQTKRKRNSLLQSPASEFSHPNECTGSKPSLPLPKRNTGLSLFPMGVAQGNHMGWLKFLLADVRKMFFAAGCVPTDCCKGQLIHTSTLFLPRHLRNFSYTSTYWGPQCWALGTYRYYRTAELACMVKLHFQGECSQRETHKPDMLLFVTVLQ